MRTLIMSLALAAAPAFATPVEGISGCDAQGRLRSITVPVEHPGVLTLEIPADVCDKARKAAPKPKAPASAPRGKFSV